MQPLDRFIVFRLSFVWGRRVALGRTPPQLKIERRGGIWRLLTLDDIREMGLCEDFAR